MRSSITIPSFAFAHAVLFAIGLPLAHADSPAVATAEHESAVPPFMLDSDVGYQFSNHDALSGLVDSFLLGIQVRSPSTHRRDFIEVGVAQLHAGDSDTLPSSYLLVGARSAWSWDRIGLHLFGHLRHGDAASDGDFSTASQSASVGLIASLDIWRGADLSAAIGLHATANIYQALDAGDQRAAASGSTGLSVIVW
jgi:hypothetical protein